ncbi:dUTP diphosphatase [Edhazardia aedis USNM 41457]|uniref:Deoxyuridine 5'-triphosphate nucleotidohydrolase n=1 Tax=Edhazardia aedis (strain USNM 41457) TaxID=1003232 RepID=J9D7F7_EDHAE|nr:dUTP diphosphatase [Edhazardia aedis USNM 41457]|eukprot:EJW03716.1 dUTP diphosphatase [Edhazardia aedis USNM 41457]
MTLLIIESKFIPSFMSEIPNICVKIATENATAPQQTTSSLKLFSAESAIIEPGKKLLVSSGLQVSIPTGYYGQLYKTNDDLLLLGGVIDSDYRGEIKGILYNSGTNNVTINVGDYLCHIVFVKILTSNVEICENLDGSERGSSGFGSTGQ